MREDLVGAERHPLAEVAVLNRGRLVVHAVEIEENLVYKVEEKPEIVSNNLCGMGFYFFDRRVFKYIEVAKPSTLRNEVEITNVIQDMIDKGERIAPVLFHGDYLNINYPRDVIRAEGIL